MIAEVVTTWKALKAGDVIVCPVSGLPEKVHSNRFGGQGRRAVRTNRHDHIRPSGDAVTRWTREPGGS